MVTHRRPGVVLLYHDVVPRNTADESGIVTEGSWRYKLSPKTFRAHLDRITSSSYQVTTLPDINSDRPLLITFDDGGSSCVETIAPLLETYGIRGHFFVITGRLGDDGYLTRQQVRDLAAAGHHVGSHTVTHANLRTLSSEKRLRELRESKSDLENLLGTECLSVSVPGGFAGEHIIADAFDVGYDYVFVSEPRYLSLPAADDSIGRWNVWHDTSAAELGRILDRSLRARFRVQGRWYILRTAKRIIGQDRFERLRSPFISQE